MRFFVKRGVAVPRLELALLDHDSIGFRDTRVWQILRREVLVFFLLVS